MKKKKKLLQAFFAHRLSEKQRRSAKQEFLQIRTAQFCSFQIPMGNEYDLQHVPCVYLAFLVVLFSPLVSATLIKFIYLFFPSLTSINITYVV